MQPLQTDDAAPWKQRYRLPVEWAQVASANPSRGLVVSNRSGMFQLYAWNVTNGRMNPLTHKPTGKISGIIAPDGSAIYYHDDAAGNEIGHFVRVPFDDGATSEDVTPDMPQYASWNISASLRGGRLGFIAANDGLYRVYTLLIDPVGGFGSPHLLFVSQHITYGPWISPDGELAVIASTERSGNLDTSLIALNPHTGERVGELFDEGASIDFATFARHLGDGRVAATTNRSGVARPLIWNSTTGERTDIPLPELEGEVSVLDWSHDGSALLLSRFNAASQQLYHYDIASATLTALAHPPGTYQSVAFLSDDEIIARWQDSAHPAQTVALDAHTGEWRRVILPAAQNAPAARPWRSVTFPSADGTAIQGWLATPDGAGPFPTILETHGGPTSVQTEAFAPGSQAWLDHGFAFLTINYRGSTTFGKEFEQQIWGDLGNYEVEDMVAARTFLVREGVARPDEILLTGWSYGGYLTLMALGKQPDLWAGGMAGIAIADWTVQYEDTADTLRGYQVALLGGTPDQKPEQYRKSSPITYADQVRAPVLVIQGSNDTRCPPRPLRMYEEKLCSLGRDIEVHWFEAGHGSYIVEQSIEHQEQMLRFAYRVLG